MITMKVNASLLLSSQVLIMTESQCNQILKETDGELEYKGVKFSVLRKTADNILFEICIITTERMKGE